MRVVGPVGIRPDDLRFMRPLLLQRVELRALSEDAEVLLHFGLFVKRKNHPIFQRWFGKVDDVSASHRLRR